MDGEEEGEGVGVGGCSKGGGCLNPFFHSFFYFFLVFSLFFFSFSLLTLTFYYLFSFNPLTILYSLILSLAHCPYSPFPLSLSLTLAEKQGKHSHVLML